MEFYLFRCHLGSKWFLRGGDCILCLRTPVDHSKCENGPVGLLAWLYVFKKLKNPQGCHLAAVGTSSEK